jgi:hypothetical protein
VATAGLLLDSVTVAAAAGAAASVTVPCAVPPIPIREALNVTPEIEDPGVVGEVGEFDPPHRAIENAAKRNAATEMNDEVRGGMLIPSGRARTGPVSVNS